MVITLKCKLQSYVFGWTYLWYLKPAEYLTELLKLIHDSTTYNLRDFSSYNLALQKPKTAYFKKRFPYPAVLIMAYFSNNIKAEQFIQ